MPLAYRVVRARLDVPSADRPKSAIFHLRSSTRYNTTHQNPDLISNRTVTWLQVPVDFHMTVNESNPRRYLLHDVKYIDIIAADARQASLLPSAADPLF